MKTQQNSHHQKNTFVRIILQTFVWALIIAFVSTLGVMWDGTNSGFPTIIKSSKGTVDLSPRSLYFMEYDRLYDELFTNNQNIDPRVLTRYTQNLALTNTENIFARQLFYQSIKLKPSAKTYQSLLANTGLNSNTIDFQYAENYYNSPLGISSIQVTPTLSDLYTITDLQKLNIVIELIALNKTNFIYSQIAESNVATFYQENFEKWLDSITFHEFQTETRKEARELLNKLNKETLEKVLKELPKTIIFSSNINLVANNSNFTYFNNILISYKSNITSKPFISEPIYLKGKYNIVIIENLPSFEILTSQIKREITAAYVNQNFHKLSKKFDNLWKEQIVLFEKNITNDSFSALQGIVQGSVVHNTQPFTLAQLSITNVLGNIITLPLLQNREILDSILYTPLSTSSKVLSPTKELYIATRPIFRQYNNSQKTNDLNSPQTLQKIYQYKAILFRDSLNTDSRKKQYKIESDYNQLINLN